jgi:glutamate 5-kinase
MKTIVVKLGTSSLTNGTKRLSRPHMAEIVKQLKTLINEGHRVALVSSGAIATGREYFQSNDTTLATKQMLAAIGQVHLMNAWSELFRIYDLQIGQVLLTRDDIGDEKRANNARNTLCALLSHGIVPIINENDSVATEEIRFGDNDRLSALVAHLVGAELLIILTDQAGLYTADPRCHPDARLIETVEFIDESLTGCATGSSHPEGLGTGGMATKIQAAQFATTRGTATIIASSQEPNVIVNILQGKSVGTLFTPLRNYGP